MSAAEEAGGIAEDHDNVRGLLEGGKLEGVKDLGVERVQGPIRALTGSLELASLGQVAAALVIVGVVDAKPGALDGGTLAEVSGGHDVPASGVSAILTHEKTPPPLVLQARHRERLASFPRASSSFGRASRQARQNKRDICIAH